MSGRISLDDRALDGSARRLRSVKGSLAGLQGQLNDGLAGGAPPAVAGQVRGAVGAARSAVSAVDGQLGWRAAELTRRAALTRLANGDGSVGDIWTTIKWGAGKTQFKDFAGGVDEALKRWSDFWEKNYLRRKPGVARAGIGKKMAWLKRKTIWVERQNAIKKHAGLVKKLRGVSKTIRVLSIAADAAEVVTAKGPVKQNEAAGGAVGGAAGAIAGAQVGATIGAFGGPIGVAVGGGVGALVGGVAGSAIGKHIGRAVGKTAVGKAIGKGIDGAKSAVSGAAKGVVGGAKKIFKKVKLW